MPVTVIRVEKGRVRHHLERKRGYNVLNRFFKLKFKINEMKGYFSKNTEPKIFKEFRVENNDQYKEEMN